MSVLLDTNILSHVAQPANPRHSTSLAALDALADRGEDLVIVPQNLYEFYVVCTPIPLMFSINGSSSCRAST